MDQVYLGFIGMFGFDFAPRGWVACDGRLLPVSAYDALFALLGTRFGGDGKTTFAVPDLRGRVPVNAGQGDGLEDHPLGEMFGQEATTLTVNEMPAHRHEATATSTLVAEAAAASAHNPQERILAAANIYADTDPADNEDLAEESVSTAVQVGDTGAGQPFSNLQPTLAVNFCIAIQGVFPPRD